MINRFSSFRWRYLSRSPAGIPESPDAADPFASQREQMVKKQLIKRGIRDPRVLEAMGKVPRHLFVPPDLRDRAYRDCPLPIGYGQTISQPYIVAFMTEAAHLTPESVVLEIGTGSGYQAAVLAELARQVYSLERLPPLAAQAQQTLAALGYGNVEVRQGDGYQGWPEHAPYDAILVTAAPPTVPTVLLEQLAVGGTLVVPVGETGAQGSQSLLILCKTAQGWVQKGAFPVQFVPMV
ncbi:MAG TPA: protein-L-isoaspartate(D-aspartate) O-methyltransferase [Synechococcus sp. M44_DOE_062]|nr:protein-L-isoaspartate(D-aspartate) O-methyltransferase [Synechococcus sp. M44_DOE_062]